MIACQLGLVFSTCLKLAALEGAVDGRKDGDLRVAVAHQALQAGRLRQSVLSGAMACESKDQLHLQGAHGGDNAGPRMLQHSTG